MKRLILLLTSLTFCLIAQLSNATSHQVGDTIFAPRIIQTPVIDGVGTDLCWDSAAWNPMPYAWKPYAEIIDSTDFHGRFKAVWNRQQNLMYFLFEITDNKFVNGYVFSKGNGDYPLYDVVEIFIDENHSGGEHSVSNNAFAYHITSGNATTYFDVVDIWPDWNWSSNRVNYKDHFPEFKRSNTGNVYTWEFSMMVLTDAFTPDFAPSGFKSVLQADKEMGFSAAYCDNDHSAANPQRDHFVGSKYLTEANSDASWQNASVFGYMKLVNEPTANHISTAIPKFSETIQINVYPNPVTDFAAISFNSHSEGKVDISVYNSYGQLLNQISTYKYLARFEQRIDFKQFRKGVYFINVDTGNKRKVVKVIK
jgi:hypothetical protein